MLSGYGYVFGEKVGKDTNDGIEEVVVEEVAGGRSLCPSKTPKMAQERVGRWQEVEEM